MIMHEKIKVMKKTIPNSSNSFLFRKSYIRSKIPTDYPQNPRGFITVPIPIPYPYPWESPWESPHPRQPCLEYNIVPSFIRLKYFTLHYKKQISQNVHRTLCNNLTNNTTCTEKQILHNNIWANA